MVVFPLLQPNKNISSIIVKYDRDFCHMNFDFFLETIPKIVKRPLPGSTSHYKMASLMRLQELNKVSIEALNPKKAAVLLLFYPNKQKETSFVLIQRKKYPGVHSHQIAFPGGKVEESDKDLAHTALREAEEEVGIASHKVNLLRPLTQVYIPPSNFMVTPFMGFSDFYPDFSAQPSEVEQIIEVTLEEFLNEAVVVTQKLTTSYAKNIEVPAFVLKGHTVWGATAMMLSEAKELIKESM